MNEQDEKLVRQSRWSGRRVILLYWFAMVFIGTSAGLGLASTHLKPSFRIEAYDHSGLGITEPWHPEDCSPCHDDKIDAWNDTFHFTLWGDKLTDNGTHITRWIRYPMVGSHYNYTEFNLSSGCCMVTRWNNITENPSEPAFWDYGVTCAACHDNPGSVNHTAEQCGKCHGGASRIFTYYNMSKHNQSLPDLLANVNAADDCLHCMAGQGLYWNMTGVSPTNSTLVSISCATCHDPHSDNSTESPRAKDTNFLRGKDVNDLCGKCHASNSITDHNFPENMTKAFLNVTNGFDCTDCHGYDSGAYGKVTKFNHSMALVISEACTQCHLVVPELPECPPTSECPNTTECPTTTPEGLGDTTTTTTTTTTAAPAIGLIAVMGILGVIVLFQRKRR